VPRAFPSKLREGSHIRVIAPATSRAAIGGGNRPTIDRRLDALGLTVSFGAHVDELDPFGSAGAASRLADLHAAFSDPAVDGILTVIGGHNCNELLPGVDWGLIRAHPKVLCGFSDITALQCAMLARSDLVTYSGPHWSTFGIERHFEPTLQAFVDCLFGEDPLVVRPSREWSDDPWYLDQADRHLRPNEGWWVLTGGTATGEVVGGNLCTLNLLQGTTYLPALAGTVLFLEDDFESGAATFRRNLVSLLQQPGADAVVGVVMGRFQRQSGVHRELLTHMVAALPHLSEVPVIANVDFGHTDPMITFPIGGTVEIAAEIDGPSTIRIVRH
jgi:muramoyltetrapeptide carboxypeptidase